MTAESVAAARRWFADNALACAALARSRGTVLQEEEFHVNDLEQYQATKRALAAECLAGEYDHTFALLQKIHFIQTGESVALLPKRGTLTVRHNDGVYTLSTQGVDAAVIAQGKPAVVAPVLASCYDVVM